MLSDALIGVIIGGLIGSITPVVTLVAEHKRWKKETRIEHLRLKRDKLEKAFDGVPEQLEEAVKTALTPLTWQVIFTVFSLRKLAILLVN